MTTTTTTKTIAEIKAQEQSTVEAEISKLTIMAMAAGSAAIGIWGLACFIGGMVASGGPLAFIGNWFRAVSGM